jgi:hypothetical protein
MGTIMSIIEGGIFLIVGSLGTMQVLLTPRMPSRRPQESNTTGAEGETNSGVDKDIPLVSGSSRPKHIPLENIRPVEHQIASYEFC